MSGFREGESGGSSAEDGVGNKNLLKDKDVEVRTEEIAARENHLISLGFSQEWIAGLKERKPTLYAVEAVSSLIDKLKQHGFKDPCRMIRLYSNILQIALDTIDAKLAGLTERGFKDPRKMVESYPNILGYALDTIDAKLAGLTERGFKDPRKMVESHISILASDLKSIDAKLAGLTERGFKDPRKMVESHGIILSYDLKSIDAKLAGLTERGFKDPRKMVESFSSILGLSLDTIDAKLAGLTERGFKDPRKMVESYPNILGYDFKNIDKKLQMLARLFEMYQISFSVNEIIEKQLSILGTKLDKLWILARICKKYLNSSEQVTPQLINQLLFSNLENLLISIQTDPPVTAIGELLKRAKEIKKQGLSKKEKRRRIISGSHTELGGIYERYIRGYPVNDNDGDNEANVA